MNWTSEKNQELVRTEFGALSGVTYCLLAVLGRVSLTASRQDALSRVRWRR